MRFKRFKVPIDEPDVLVDMETLFWAEPLYRKIGEFTRALFVKSGKHVTVEIKMKFDQFVELVEHYEMEKEKHTRYKSGLERSKK